MTLKPMMDNYVVKNLSAVKFQNSVILKIMIVSFYKNENTILNHKHNYLFRFVLSKDRFDILSL